jgi:hypothetical protein
LKGKNNLPEKENEMVLPNIYNQRSRQDLRRNRFGGLVQTKKSGSFRNEAAKILKIVNVE